MSTRQRSRSVVKLKQINWISMENHPVTNANDDQDPNVGWFRGQELALQLGLATFLCLAALFIGRVTPFLGLFAFAEGIAIILEKLAELIYNGDFQYPFLMAKIFIYVVLEMMYQLC